MKITRDEKLFKPVTIVLETEKELIELAALVDVPAVTRCCETTMAIFDFFLKQKIYEEEKEIAEVYSRLRKYIKQHMR